MNKIMIADDVLNYVTKHLRRKSISYLDVERAMKYLRIDSQKENFSELEKKAILQFLKVKIEREKVVKGKALNTTLENKLNITTKQLQITNDRIIEKLDKILDYLNNSNVSSKIADSSFSVESKHNFKNMDHYDPIISMFASRNDDNK